MKILFGDASHLQIKQENDENIRVTSKISFIHLTTVKLHAISLYCINLHFSKSKLKVVYLILMFHLMV